ncbi:LysR family transcriptional regulator [Kitasatospora sp. NPDC004240]
MPDLDLNLLVALDALLEEGSVTGAAHRLHTSAPAMSRTLARLRRVLGDPLLVRAGRGLVPTPRAIELRTEVRALVARGQALLVPVGAPRPDALERRFTLQVGDVLLTVVGAALIAAVRERAPGVTLSFLPEHLEGTAAMRDGTVDLEVGVVDHTDPETRTQRLTTTRVVGVTRAGHPLAGGRPSAGGHPPADGHPDGQGHPVHRPSVEEYAAAGHLVVTRHGRAHGPVDHALAELGLTRRVVATVPGFATALLLIRETDLVGLAPAGFGEGTARALGLALFEIPLDLPAVDIGMAWHPRNDADPAHRWLRAVVHEVVAGHARP